MEPYLVRYIFDFLAMINGITIMLNYYLFKKDVVYIVCIALALMHTLLIVIEYFLF